MTDWKKLFQEPAKPTQQPTQAPEKKSWKNLFNQDMSVQLPDTSGLSSTVEMPASYETNKSFPAAPKWFNVVDHTGITLPESERERAEGLGENLTAGSGVFNRAVAGFFNQLDWVHTTMGDIVTQIQFGTEVANESKKLRDEYGVYTNNNPLNTIRPFKVIADALNSMAYHKDPADNWKGDVVSGIAHLGPDMIAAAIAPEIKAGMLLQKMGATTLSKFGMVLGVRGLAEGAQVSEQGTAGQKLTVPIIRAAEQYMTGWAFDNMGAMASKLGGKMAESFIPEVKSMAQAKSKMLLHATGTTLFNSLMFGGYGTSSEFLETGKTSWRTLGSNVGMGLALGSREVGKTLWAKGMTSFIAAPPEALTRMAESKVSSAELVEHARIKTESVEKETSKNPEGDVSAALLAVNTATTKAVIEAFKENPTEVMKSVEESTMEQPVKDHIVDKLNRLQAESDPAVKEAAPHNKKLAEIDAEIEMISKNTHLAAEDIKIKTAALAMRRDAVANTVMQIHEKHKAKTPAEEKAAAEKKLEDEKQSRLMEIKAAQVFPVFQETGTKIAEELGGKFESRLKSPESMVEKATREGKVVTPKPPEKVVYHADFVKNPESLKKEFPPVHKNQFYHHATLEFKPESSEGIETGKAKTIQVTGRLTTSKVDVLLVNDPKSKNKDAHITLSTADGIKPVESNKEIEANRDKIVAMDKTINVTEGYFDGKNDVTAPAEKQIEDVVGGSLVVPDLLDFRKASRRLKQEGYTISNRRAPNKETGWQGVVATKTENGVPFEIQLHTEATLKAQRAAEKLYDPYKKGKKEREYVLTLPDSNTPTIDKMLEKQTADNKSLSNLIPDLIDPKKTPRVEFDEIRKQIDPENSLSDQNVAKKFIHFAKASRGYDTITLDNIGKIEENLLSSLSESKASREEIADIQSNINLIKRYLNEQSAGSEASGSKRLLPEETGKISRIDPGTMERGGGTYEGTYSERRRGNTEAKVTPEEQVSKRLAPNGEKSNLPDDLHDFVRTPSFKKNFGDWQKGEGSLILDANGEPLYVYTGQSQIHKKGIDPTKTSDGTFFTGDHEQAIIYANHDKTVRQPVVYGGFVRISEADLKAGSKIDKLPLDAEQQEFVIRSKDQFIPDRIFEAPLRHPERVPKTLQMHSHEVSGGSTFTADGRNLSGVKDRASVSIFPDRTQIIDGPISALEIKKFADKNRDILNGNEDIFAIGTWFNKNDGTTVLDLVTAPGKERAIELGKKYDQEAVYDLEIGKDIPTGGTGKVDIANKFSIEERIADATKTPYQAAMETSKSLYNEAYKGMEDINLEGSTASTPQQRKMKAIGLPVSVQKELHQTWMDMKKKLVSGIKEKNADMKEEFKQYVKDMPLTGLGVPLRKAMLNKVNNIDWTKPTSLQKAIDYFDRIISDATFRLQEIQYHKALTFLDEKSSPANLDKKVNGILKAKAGPDFLPTRDKINEIRKNMLEGDWEAAQTEIFMIESKYRDNNDPMTLQDLQRIEDLSFHGLLNRSSRASLPEMNGAVRNMKELFKYGRKEAAARKMARRDAIDEFKQIAFNILDGKPGKPVQLEPKLAENITPSAWTKFIRNTFDWVQLDSFASVLDKLSIHHKESDPYESPLNRELHGAAVRADVQTYKETTELYKVINDKAKEIFGSKGLRRGAQERTKKLHTIDYVENGVDKSMTLTINQAGKKYMEFQDPSLQKANRGGKYKNADGQLTDLGQKIVDMLPENVKKWADWHLEEFYPMMYEIINPTYRQRNGRDMPMGEKYSPIYVADKGGKITEDDLLANQTLTSNANNAHLMTRTEHGNELALMDMDKVLFNYVDKMIYYKNWSDALDLFNSVFKDPNIKKAIDQNFGSMYNKVIDNFIQDFARVPRDLNTVNKFLDKMRGNFTIASLSFRIPVFFTQLTAIPAYMEKVPILSYGKEVWNAVTDPKGTWEILQEIRKDPFWEQRFRGGWDRDVINAMREDLKSVGESGFQKWKNWSMFVTKYGDIGALMIGGVPLYRHVYNEAIKEMGPGNERMAKAKAMAAFAQATRESQQAGQTYDLSVIQRSNSFAKLLTMYKTSPLQYHRKVVGAIRNFKYGRGDKLANIKTLAIYHVILPQLFQLVGNGFKWDKDDQKRALLYGNFNEIFMAGDIVKGLNNAWRGLPFDYQLSPVESTWTAGQKAARHLQSADLEAIFSAVDDVNMHQLLEAIEDGAKVIGDVSGLPIHGILSMARGVSDVAKGETEYPVRRILGWSEWSLENGVDFFSSDEDRAEAKKLMDDTKHPTLDKINKYPVKKAPKPLPVKTGKKP
jgi:hypothetical protein